MSLIPARQDFWFFPGTELPMTFTLTDGTSPVDITADTVTFRVFDQYGQIIFIKVNGVGGHTDPGKGVTAFTLDRDQTKWWEKADFWTYTVERTISSSGQKFVYIVGELLGM